MTSTCDVLPCHALPVATPERTEVVVVGAGPAGLRTADLLQRRGVETVVLEARDRVGGRLLSVPAASGWVDLGATWFWANEPDVIGLAAAEGLDVFDQHLAGDMVFQNATGVQRIAGNQIDVPSKRLAGGMQSLATALLHRLKPGTVRLSQPVRSVGKVGGGIEVVTDVGVWQAEHVVIAVPPATAEYLIDFGDGLSDDLRTLAAATPVWMGAFAKIVAWYDRAFWREAGLAGAAFSHVGPMRELHDMSGPDGSPAALFGFVPLQAGVVTPSRDTVLAQLVELFGAEGGEPLGLEIADWRAAPYTSPPNADVLTNYGTYGHALFREAALGGHLHWASSETATDVPGHAQGALSAAARVAAAISV